MDIIRGLSLFILTRLCVVVIGTGSGCLLLRELDCSFERCGPPNFLHNSEEVKTFRMENRKLAANFQQGSESFYLKIKREISTHWNPESIGMFLLDIGKLSGNLSKFKIILTGVRSHLSLNVLVVRILFLKYHQSCPHFIYKSSSYSTPHSCLLLADGILLDEIVSLFDFQDIKLS